MNSFFYTYFLDLQKRINELAPSIKWIDGDYGQDVNNSLRPSVDFPAALIDFPNAEYENMALGGTTVKVEVQIRLLVAVFSQSYDVAPDEVRGEALQYFEIERELTNALHGWQPDKGYAQPLIIERASTSSRNDKGIRIRTLNFTTEYEEYADDNGIFKIVPPVWQ